MNYGSAVWVLQQARGADRGRSVERVAERGDVARRAPVRRESGPMWAPDGRTISALIHTRTSTEGLLTIDVTGTARPMVVPATGNSGGTSWQRLAP